MTGHMVPARVCLAFLLLLAFGLLRPHGVLYGQGSIQNVSQTPFVTGLIPVVGPGVVGGVKVDAKGIVQLATATDLRSIKEARESALSELGGDLTRASKSRKISLRRLNEALRKHKTARKPVSNAMQYLAGLQQIRYVFVYPEANDIILVGAAEGWTVNDQGEVVGVTTGRPLCLLDDLIVALRNAHTTKVATMSCSIDPQQLGVVQLQRFLRRKGLRVNEVTLADMERAMGPQKVTFEGIPSTTHFAHVMLASDVRMKRLAMGLENPPVSGLPSFQELMKRWSGSPPKNMMPRWWLAPDYEPLNKGARGLAWELRGRSVKALTEENSHLLAQKWASAMSAKFPELSEKIPVFAKLQNCMDLAVVAALVTDYQLFDVAGFDPDFLLDHRLLQAGQFSTPSALASHATAVKKGRTWIISVSGGVEMNPWKTLDDPVDWMDTADYRAMAPMKNARSSNWWWD